MNFELTAELHSTCLYALGVESADEVAHAAFDRAEDVNAALWAVLVLADDPMLLSHLAGTLLGAANQAAKELAK